MDMSTNYRLHINLRSSRGVELHRCRPVDTFVEAERIAAEGHKLDQEDGGVTTYRLFIWETCQDRSNLVRDLTL